MFFFYLDFLINSKSKPRPLSSIAQKNFVAFTAQNSIYCPNFIQIDNVQQCHFQFFELFWVMLTPKIFSKNLNLRVFFRAILQHITWKKSKIVRVTARTILAGMSHIIVFLITYGVCKKRKYYNRMSEKKLSPFDECSCFVYVKRQKEHKKISVCLSVCLDVRTYVNSWTCGHNNFRRS